MKDFCNLGEAGLLERRRKRAGLRELERVGSIWLGWFRFRKSFQNAGRGHVIGVAFRNAPGAKCRAPARFQDATDLSQGFRQVGKQHDAEPASGAIECGGSERQHGGIRYLESDVAKVEFPGGIFQRTRRWRLLRRPSRRRHPDRGIECVDCFSNEHMAQCINYLKASGLKIALLVNFQRPKVEWRRVVLNP